MTSLALIAHSMPVNEWTVSARHKPYNSRGETYQIERIAGHPEAFNLLRSERNQMTRIISGGSLSLCRHVLDYFMYGNRC